MGARVGEQDNESVREEELGVSGHADAIVALAMEEHYGIAVAAVRMERPGTERDGVRSDDGNILEIRIEVVSDLAHCCFLVLSQRAADGMQSAVG